MDIIDKLFTPLTFVVLFAAWALMGTMNENSKRQEKLLFDIRKEINELNLSLGRLSNNLSPNRSDRHIWGDD